MDITHVPSSVKLAYVHVTVDINSKFIWATACAGESTRHVISHLCSCFATMGLPQNKTQTMAQLTLVLLLGIF